MSPSTESTAVDKPRVVRTLAEALSLTDEDWCCDECRLAAVEDGYYDKKARAALAALTALSARFEVPDVG